MYARIGFKYLKSTYSLSGFMTDEQKPLAIIEPCMDRRLIGLVEEIRSDLIKQRFEVHIESDGGANPDPLENRLRSAKESGRLKRVVLMPHSDCGYVSIAADVLFFGLKVNPKLEEEIKRAFEGFDPKLRPGDGKSPELLERMEKWLPDYEVRRVKEIVGADVEIILMVPNARAITLPHVEAKVGHTQRALVVTSDSSASRRELLKLTGTAFGETYFISADAMHHAELAPAVHAKEIVFVGRGEAITKQAERLREMPMITEANLKAAASKGREAPIVSRLVRTDTKSKVAAA